MPLFCTDLFHKDSGITVFASVRADSKNDLALLLNCRYCISFEYTYCRKEGVKKKNTDKKKQPVSCLNYEVNRDLKSVKNLYFLIL